MSVDAHKYLHFFSRNHTGTFSIYIYFVYISHISHTNLLIWTTIKKRDFHDLTVPRCNCISTNRHESKKDHTLNSCIVSLSWGKIEHWKRQVHVCLSNSMTVLQIWIISRLLVMLVVIIIVCFIRYLYIFSWPNVPAFVIIIISPLLHFISHARISFSTSGEKKIQMRITGCPGML